MNSSLLPATSIIIQSIGWALLYSLWQGLLIYAVLAILLKLLKNANARIKYNISMFAFAGLFLWFADTWITEWQRLQKITVFVTESGTNTDISKTSSLITFPHTESPGQLLHHLLPQLEKYMPLIVGIYLIGLLLMLFRFTINLFNIRTLRKKGIVEPNETLRKQFAQWQMQLNIIHPVKLYLSKCINVPMMMGTLKPVILLPMATIAQLSTDQLEAIILHELAHIKRHDYLLNIFQTIVETVLFFNPFVWWMSSAIRREREHCCDDLVIANTSSTLPYAKALATLESQRLDTSAIALAASGNKTQLFNRIKRIMEMKKNSINYAQLTTAALLVLILLVSISWLTPGFAQKANNKQSAQPHKQEQVVTKQKIVITDDDGNTKEYDSIDQLPKEEKEKLKKALDRDEKKANKIVKKEIIIKKGNSKEGKDEDLSIALKEVDKALKEVDKALKETDWDKIGRDLNADLKKVDSALKEVDKSMKEGDWKEMSKDLQEKLEDIKKQLPDTGEQKKIIMKIKKNIDRNTDKAYDEINEVIEKNKEQLEEMRKAEKAYAYAYANSDDDKKIHVSAPKYDKMLEKMDADGLIDRVSGFKIEKKGNRLFINDIEQTNLVFNKYKRYLNNKHVIVNGDKDHININVKD